LLKFSLVSLELKIPNLKLS